MLQRVRVCVREYAGIIASARCEERRSILERELDLLTVASPQCLLNRGHAPACIGCEACNKAIEETLKQGGAALQPSLRSAAMK